MGRGKEYKKGEREKAYALWAEGESAGAISKKLKIPASTVRTWLKNKKPDEFDEIREEKARARVREEIDNASDIIENGMKLLKKRLLRALNREEEIDELMNEVVKSDISEKEKAATIKMLSELKLASLKDVAICVGTICDKRIVLENRKEAGEETSGGLIILPEIKEE